jgi:hypothetical protein
VEEDKDDYDENEDSECSEDGEIDIDRAVAIGRISIK